MKKIFKTISVVFVISILIKVIDVVRNLFISSNLGVSEFADIYNSIIVIPDMILIFLGFDSLKGVVNSEYSAWIAEGKVNEVKTSIVNLSKLLLFAGILLSIVFLFSREYIVSILLPGFKEVKRNITIDLLIYITPLIVLKAIIGFATASLNSFKKFYLPAITPGIISSSIILLILFPIFSTRFLDNISIANLLGNVVITIIMVAGLLKLLIGYNRQREISFVSLDIMSIKVLKNCSAILMVVVCNMLFLSSKNFFASYFGNGAISAIVYASTIPGFISSMSFSVIFTVLLSNLSSGFAEKNFEYVRKMYYSFLTGLFYVIMPFIIFLLIFGKEILEILYLRGKFDSIGVEMTYGPYIWETLSLFSFVLYIVPTALFLATKNYNRINKIGAFFYLSGIIIIYIATLIWGFVGVSIANFFVTSLYGMVLLFYSRFEIGKFKEYKINILKIVSSGLIISLIMFICHKFIIFNQVDFFHKLFYVAGMFIIMSISYLIISFFLKIEFAVFLHKQLLPRRK